MSTKKSPDSKSVRIQETAEKKEAKDYGLPSPVHVAEEAGARPKHTKQYTLPPPAHIAENAGTGPKHGIDAHLKHLTSSPIKDEVNLDQEIEELEKSVKETEAHLREIEKKKKKNRFKRKKDTIFGKTFT